MKNKQILIIGPLGQGGITSVINLHLNNGLNEAEFLPSYVEGSLFAKLYYFLKFLTIFIFKISNKNIKIVHIHTATKGSFLRKAIIFYLAKLFKKKTIFHVHGAEFNIFYSKSSDIVKKIVNNIFTQSDIVLALSKQWHKDLSEKSHNNNVRVLYNPLTLKFLKTKQDETIKVLFMGRLGQRKGTYDIVEAAKNLKCNKIEITLFGDGEIDEIQALINKNNLNDKLKVGGWISGEDVDNAYQDADIYILPSYNEGLPMSVLEAMSYGLPVITTPAGGTPEAVENGLNGYLIEPGDYRALAEKIDILANDKELREKMGKNGYEIAKAKFDISIIIAELNKLYEELL